MFSRATLGRIMKTLVGGVAVLTLTAFLYLQLATVRTTLAELWGGPQPAAVFFVESVDPDQLRNLYQARALAMTQSASSSAPKEKAVPSARKIRILIVPGHEPQSGGTEFNGVYERDIVVDIAQHLALLLSANPNYEVMVARGKEAWDSTLETYFETHAGDIDTFRRSQIELMQRHVSDGLILPEADQVYHETAPTEIALHLYGINRWASENHYDIVLHLHINDYGSRRAHAVGKYDGFAVYVPDHQYSNARASREIGESIAARLNAYHATSTVPGESGGTIPDQELIAVGSNNSVDSAGVLIEYGYIYEPQFRHRDVRTIATYDYAYETYLGIQDFFGDPISSRTGFPAFPASWDRVSVSDGEHGKGIYSLQAALRYLGNYPPRGKSLSDCPISGAAGTCTRLAIKQYQEAHGLETTGTLGPLTRKTLSQDLVP